ncbi:hypothetical protein ACWEQL_41220 [Kitasatospora sp. NPDC004240]
MRGNSAARAALGLTTALLVAACGSGGTGDGKAAGGGPSASGAPAATAPGAPGAAPGGAQPPAPATPAGPAKALDKTALTAAALAAGDVSGYTVMPIPAEVGSKEGLPTRPADCQPVENIRTGKINPHPSAYAAAMLTPPQGTSPAVAVSILLAGLDEAGAKKVLADLRTALTTCTKYEGGIPQPGTVAALPAPSVGDEAVSYTLSYGSKSQELVVVRQGTVITAFSAALMTSKGAEPGAVKVPQAVVTAQVEKLRKAG